MGESVVGRVDHDRDEDRWWLAPDEVNIGDHVSPAYRNRGHATRAGCYRTATWILDDLATAAHDEWPKAKGIQMKIKTKRATITALVMPLFMVAGVSEASAAAPDDGCARGFVVWDVETEPYQADNAVDQAGNNDGDVCARALGQGAATSLGLPVDFVVYQFADNDLAPGSIG